MNSVGLNLQQNYNTIRNVKANKLNNSPLSASNSQSFTSNSINQVPFNPTMTASQLRTELISNEEKNKYNALINISDKTTRKNLNNMLKNGVLLNANSNDKSTVLDNLYKILSTKRAEGLDSKVIIKDTITALNDPYTITQQFGDIPSKYSQKALNAFKNSASTSATQKDINVEHSGTCVAASIEFNLAKEFPAEFARFTEGLSSPNIAVQKEIKLKNLADNTLDAVWLLNAFEIPFETKNFDKANLTFSPDKNAIIRAQIQTTDKDPLERSAVDVLMQSTFMQVGSQQSYDSLNDKRKGKFNQNDKGLIEFEKTFTESVVEDKNKISVTYQTVDDKARLIGYETDFNTMKKQIIQSLNMGENVIIGYTQVDKDKTIINGHEITITGVKKDVDGKIIFICNDTDDNISKAIEYKEDYLLPKIHHAALPQKVVENDVKLAENWVEGLKSYKQTKNQKANEIKRNPKLPLKQQTA